MLNGLPATSLRSIPLFAACHRRFCGLDDIPSSMAFLLSHRRDVRETVRKKCLVGTVKSDVRLIDNTFLTVA